MAIDLIGSSSSELIKPPEISKKQLNVFNYLKKQNLINNPPEVNNSTFYFFIFFQYISILLRFSKSFSVQLFIIYLNEIKTN